MQTIIIGAGASGMAAALQAAKKPGNRVRLLERQARVGKKLSATGNGRCNLTNRSASPESYHSSSGKDFHALRAFPVDDTLAFFHRLGLVFVMEPDGRYYPLSDQASSVVDVLRFALEEAGVQLELGCEVQSVQRTKNGFHLETTNGSFACDKLILAAGGPASPKLGATQDGAKLLRQLGHSVTPLAPGLVQLCASEPLLRGLKGVRAQAILRLEKGGTVLARSQGEVQFLEDGISGPAAFALSREAVSVLPCQLHLDLLPFLAEAELLDQLRARCKNLPGRTVEDLLTGMVHNRLGRVLCKKAEIDSSIPLSQLSEAALHRCAETVKDLCLDLTGSYGLDHAQVTVGGACLDQFHPRTLESLLVPGLYACGEVLDVDGNCGGFNLQWAWSSGLLAGQLRHEEVAS
ncbi:MAG: aminoacetone oxidase family FAD-binding enzyme [Oscillospiraceae bacterium]|nr:aminoacetone oxidase family FAD-binding enzyme [Oscillospiraceae bacterium]